MSKDPLGSIVLRLLGDDVSPAELRKVLRHLRDRPKFRERCSTIGMLADASDAQREAYCSHMVTVLLVWIEPLDQTGFNLVTDNERFVHMGNMNLWVDHLLSLPKSNFWHNHAKRAGIKPFVDRNDNCYITMELYEIIEAIESLWARQQQYTVLSRSKTVVEFMDDQLTARGSISSC